MGALTYGTQDLITGYERLIEAIPHVAENVNKMMCDIDLMKKESEVRTSQHTVN